MFDALHVFVEKLPESDKAAFLAALKDAEQSISKQKVLDTVNSLNMMIESDPFTINKMFTDFVLCNPTLINSPAEVIQLGDSLYVGILGVLNGCMSSSLKIVPVFADTPDYPYPLRHFTITEVK